MTPNSFRDMIDKAHGESPLGMSDVAVPPEHRHQIKGSEGPEQQPQIKADLSGPNKVTVNGVPGTTEESFQPGHPTKGQLWRTVYSGGRLIRQALINGQWQTYEPHETN